MDLQLAGQTAVVVGAAQGIGLAIAREFATEGSDVVLVDRDARVEATAAELAQDRGARTLPIVADITDYAAIEQAAENVMQWSGRIDYVVHAAATGSGKYGYPFWNLSPGDWPRVLEVNILGAVHVAHAFTPVMIAARQGTLLFLSSVAGQIGSQTDPPYSATKAALINFAQCAAKDLAAHNVRVNTLCPGMVKTTVNRAVWQSWHDQQPVEKQMPYERWADEKVRRVVPLQRWQQPEDIAAMAVFLASARAHNITGQTINIDGGFVMHW
jgi:NAD(P)-dependent dehydrogenase (short-subunit alcohol dehydrogenase family)